ncbi:hypothetical protein BD779DRAFT_1455863 [Infundibulicybe gibba]|nr:hypothetical protein BD779DRAFT_1455863 [Infundibulicybe gibba]
MAHRIVDVRHVPGVLNVADGISRQYEGTPKGQNDGSEWSVSPDWEDRTGLVHDLYQLSAPDMSTEMQTLKPRFKDKPLFTEVIDALAKCDQHLDLKTQSRARHWALGYSIDEGKLWFIGGGTKARARPRRECISKKEAIEEAWKEHQENGHWHRDQAMLIKMSLLDRFHSPKLDESMSRQYRIAQNAKTSAAPISTHS